MAITDIQSLDDEQKAQLVEARWTSSDELWEKVEQIYKANTRVYENRADWLQFLPQRRRNYRVQANRVFVNMEAVINSLIAQPPGINVLPSREGVDAQDFARKLERYFRNKYTNLNVKETLRMGLRNLYFGRLIIIKAFWNTSINDFDYRAIDPRNVRIPKYARNEANSEFIIELIPDQLVAVIERFPEKKDVLMQKYGLTTDADLFIKNPSITYKEAWIGNDVIFKLDNIILGTIKNPYWDWEGILVTEDERIQLDGDGVDTSQTLTGEARRNLMTTIKAEQVQRQAALTPPVADTAQPNASPTGSPVPPNAVVGVGEESPQDQQQETQPTEPKYRPYMFNYFDNPRKPYIFATIFNNENSPIGRTDMITLSSELQRGIDKRKMDIDENCELANGVLKVDASVMGKADAQRIRFETKGIIWGKGVVAGVQRETGAPLPAMVFEDMRDSRSEIDSIMASTSAFRGERQGSETKAGRLALVQQSYLRLNELVQVVDYVSKEIFDWGMQLAKTRYTEYHFAKWLGKEDATETLEIIQDDFETGTEVVIIAGKTLPQDDEFKFEQAQADVKEGFLSPIDYLEIAGYDNAKELSKNAFLYKVSPFSQFNISDEERAKIPPPVPKSTLHEGVDYKELPDSAKVQFLARMGIVVEPEELANDTTQIPVGINYTDLPPDGQIQAAAKAGLKLDPAILLGEKAKKEHDAMVLGQKEAQDRKVEAKTTKK